MVFDLSESENTKRTINIKIDCNNEKTDINRYTVEIEKQINTVTAEENLCSLKVRLQNCKMKKTPKKASIRFADKSAISDHIF